MSAQRASLAEAVGRLAELPGVPDAIESARAACTSLRWHQALRRRLLEAAAESRVRGAHASAELEGAPYPLEEVRAHVVGARPWSTPTDPLESVVRGCVQATAESDHISALVTRAPLQALARLHVAAVGSTSISQDVVGRPRERDERCREFTELGPAPAPSAARSRLLGVADVLLATRELPAVVVAAIVHAEVVSARPFERGNGIVARAFERAVLRTAGVDPTGVAVIEAGHGAQGTAGYLGALTAYQRGDAAGVGLWLRHCAGAIESGAAQGQALADAIVAGRLPESKV